MRVKDYIIRKLPETLRENKQDCGTLIGLPYPYNVPCAEAVFNELYYWDTYFTNKALFAFGEMAQAQHNVENILYLIERYGYMPNGNRTYLLLRSQPPYAALMVNDVFQKTGDFKFLRQAFPVLKKEYDFWMTYRVAENGLNRYGCENDDESCAEFYKNCVLPRVGVYFDRLPEEAGRHYLAEAESGWDFTPRFGGYCMDYNPVDLNSNLYCYEVLFGEYEILLGEGDGEEWSVRAEQRAKKMNTLLRDAKTGVYYDYNYKTGNRSYILSAASFQPYFVGFVNKTEKSVLPKILTALEGNYGIFTTEQGNGNFQWAHPNVWAPCQYIAVKALEKYGYANEAKQVGEKYRKLIDGNFKRFGKLFEKYNGITGGIDAVSEYGTPDMLGWTAGVYMGITIL